MTSTFFYEIIFEHIAESTKFMLFYQVELLKKWAYSKMVLHLHNGGGWGPIPIGPPNRKLQTRQFCVLGKENFNHF